MTDIVLDGCRPLLLCRLRQTRRFVDRALLTTDDHTASRCRTVSLRTNYRRSEWRNKAGAGDPLLRRLLNLLFRHVSLIVQAPFDHLILAAQFVALLELVHVDLELLLARRVFGIDVGHLLLEILHERRETYHGLLADAGAAFRVLHH